ncbi:MAG: serine hydrolase [Sphingomonas bacterium]|uniref:serine hydrolase domain-containing protein n=1 Tax=Sphingomonas bacterium TaxID=1895847 RepID=UPI002639FF23|nr:serine hydrolase domain-containing protein [Sphingomonas bacterium]MDB5696554.1 serine hydrolase [Sphingomonas bacterium]
MTNVHGYCDRDFSRVADALAANFAQRGEVGASVCVFKDGRKVVDLWGGHVDEARSRLWQEDTLVCMMSVGKGMAAIGIHQLIERGRIDPNKPVSTYWPEFAQGGKEEITVHHVLGGTSGALFADSAPDRSIFDFDEMTAAIALQPAAWPPGTRGAYQSMTMGFMLGEIIHRVDGRRLETYFQQEIAGPLDIEFGWGLNDDQVARAADIIPNPGHETLKAFADPTTNLGRAWHMRPKEPGYYNTEIFRRCVLPSSNGHGSARSVATIFAALLDDDRLVSAETRERMRSLEWDTLCGMTDRPYRYGLGFFLSGPPLVPMGPNPRAFGHPGAGGAIGFADPEARLTFAYAPNFMCAGAGSGERCIALVDALYS